MPSRGKEFVGLMSPHEEIPTSNFAKGTAFLNNFIRDNFEISTWLCFGAVAQGFLFLILGRLALIPAVAILLYKTLDVYAMSIGLKHNRYDDGVIHKKYSTAFPDELGHYGNKPANSDVVVFLIGTRCNHPLGMFAPGVQTIGGYFTQMGKDLDDHADEFGYLGMTSWLNSSDRTTAPEIMQVCYFRSIEGLHNFAHSPYHRTAWDWWTRITKTHPHISIYHETYHVPKGNWESIYVNSHVSGINATIHKYTDEMTGKDMYASPIVDASKGVMKTSAGRMSRSKGMEHDAYGEDPYQDQAAR